MTKHAQKDWYLQDWLELKKLSQQRLHQLSGWSVGKVNEVFHGQTQYRRDSVATLAEILELEPYELLMPPAKAIWLRRIEELLLEHPELMVLLADRED